MKKSCLLYLLFLLMGFTVIKTMARDEAPAPGSQNIVTADRLLGSEIRNPQGDILGNLEDLAIDWQAGRVAYAILSYGGYFGGALDIEDKQFAVPAKALQWIPGQETLLLDVDEKVIKQTQGFDKYDWPNMADRGWGKQLHQQYGQIAYWEEVAPAGKAGSALDKATAAYMHSQSTGSLQKASELMDMEVQDSAGEVVGEIKGLGIDWKTTRRAYAVVPYGGFLGIGTKAAWIPVDAMTLKAYDASAPLRFSDDNYWQLQVSKEQLREDGVFEAGP
jgi:sporulation protein YlmC with PRC-barrel domain